MRVERLHREMVMSLMFHQEGHAELVVVGVSLPVVRKEEKK